MKKKTDHDTLSREDWELDYLKKTYGVSRKDGRAAIKAVGNSRRKIMAYLLDKGLITEKA